MDNTISFGSNIKLVSPRFYQYATRKMFRNPKCEMINNWDIVVSPKCKNTDYYAYRKNMELGFTNNVRTCTAGVIVNKGENAPFFMHFLNSEENVNHIQDLKKNFKGTNAILVGSKEGFLYSRAVYDKLKKYICGNHVPLTQMQGLNPIWETSIAYNSKNDTLYMCVNVANCRDIYVKTMKQLKAVFQKVEISPYDNIEFVGKIKECLLRLKPSKIFE